MNKLSFPEMQRAVGEVLKLVSEAGLDTPALVTIMGATLMDGGWTCEEYSKALVHWLNEGSAVPVDLD